MAKPKDDNIVDFAFNGQEVANEQNSSFFAIVSDQLSKFFNMFLIHDEESISSWRQFLNPFSGIVENADYPLSKIRRSTWKERLVDIVD